MTKYISMAPRELKSIYQPVDLMDLPVSMKAWLPRLIHGR